MNWGQKPKQSNEALDLYITGEILHVPYTALFVDELSAIQRFAYDCTSFTARSDAGKYVVRCAQEKCKREDVFYVIDHTKLGFLDKLLLKISFLMVER